MSDPIEHDGAFREIRFVAVNWELRRLRLELSCGHCVLVHIDTPLGRSFRETEWEAIECNQCDDSE
jgi:hypothetical protein